MTLVMTSSVALRRPMPRISFASGSVVAVTKSGAAYRIDCPGVIHEGPSEESRRPARSGGSGGSGAAGGLDGQGTHVALRLTFHRGGFQSARRSAIFDAKGRASCPTALPYAFVLNPARIVSLRSNTLAPVPSTIQYRISALSRPAPRPTTIRFVRLPVATGVRYRFRRWGRPDPTVARPDRHRGSKCSGHNCGADAPRRGLDENAFARRSSRGPAASARARDRARSSGSRRPRSSGRRAAPPPAAG
jgi:hypothetical protein